MIELKNRRTQSPEVLRLFKALDFVCKARASRNERYSLANIQIEKNRFVATDGRRLHIAHTTHNYKAGAYQVVKHTQKALCLKRASKGNYPDCTKVIPEYTDYYHINPEYCTTATSAILALLGRHNTTINYKYLEPLDDETPWRMYLDPNTNSKPIHFIEATSPSGDLKKGDHREAIIMPIDGRLEDIQLQQEHRKAQNDH